MLRRILKILLIIISIPLILIVLGAIGFGVILYWDKWDLGIHADHSPQISCTSNQLPKVVPSPNGIYFNNYIGGIDWDGGGRGAGFYRKAIPAFGKLYGKKIAIVNVMGDWFHGIRFPIRQVKAVWESGAVPVLGMTPMSSWDHMNGPDPVYGLQKFINGEFDKDLIRYFVEVKETKIPMMIFFGGETTSGWPWSGSHNGGATKDGYGDPTYPDGPERFRDAYRHIINLSRQAGAYNLSWGYGTGLEAVEPDHPNYAEYYGDWNKDEFYYPGDDYIDWIAAGVWGYYHPFVTEWNGFRKQMDRLYAQLSKISDKAWFSIEMGVQYDPEKGDMAQWIREAYGDLKSGLYPRVKAISWWGERSKDEATGKAYDTAIDVTPEVLAAFRESVADSIFLEEVLFECIDSSGKAVSQKK